MNQQQREYSKLNQWRDVGEHWDDLQQLSMQIYAIIPQNNKYTTLYIANKRKDKFACAKYLFDIMIKFRLGLTETNILRKTLVTYDNNLIIRAFI